LHESPFYAESLSHSGLQRSTRLLNTKFIEPLCLHFYEV